jgi:hypothetical protein
MRYQRLLGWVFVGGAIAMTAVAVNQYRWRARIDVLQSDLERQAARAAFVVGGDWRSAAASAPAPVARYLLKSIRGESADIRRIDLDTAGEFRTSAGAPWLPFHASQRFTTSPPGFVWDARMRMFRLVDVYVRDAYVDGWGELVAKVGGVWTVARDAGTEALADGELMRYLAETAWFPTALLPGRNVQWTPLDDRAALATIVDRGRSVRLTFTFNALDDLIEVSAPHRWRAVGDGYVGTPWIVRCSAHDWRGVVRIPTRCEAEWLLPSGPLPYWRGDVVGIRFGPAINPE